MSTPRTDTQRGIIPSMELNPDEMQTVVKRLKNGELFDAVAKEVSDDSTAANGGDLGWFGRGRMVAEFEDAAFKLEVGQFSDIVTSQFAFSPAIALSPSESSAALL